MYTNSRGEPFIGPSGTGAALFRGDLVRYNGRVWTLGDTDIRWVVNPALAVPLTSVGTIHLVRA